MTGGGGADGDGGGGPQVKTEDQNQDALVAGVSGIKQEMEEGGESSSAAGPSAKGTTAAPAVAKDQNKPADFNPFKGTPPNPYSGWGIPKLDLWFLS